MKKGKRGNEQSLKIIGNKGPKNGLIPWQARTLNKKKNSQAKMGKKRKVIQNYQ